MLREKNTNQDKHDRKRDARQKKQLCTPRPHYVSTIVVFKHAAAIAVEPPATSSLTDAAVRGLRRSVLLMAEFTVRPRHDVPLRRALRVCSTTCILVSVFRLSAVRCPLPVCVQPALLRGIVVPNLRYRGTVLNSAGPALLRALSVSRDFTCTIPGTCTIQPALHRPQYCTFTAPPQLNSRTTGKISKKIENCLVLTLNGEHDDSCVSLLCS